MAAIKLAVRIPPLVFEINLNPLHTRMKKFFSLMLLSLLIYLEDVVELYGNNSFLLSQLSTLF